MGLHWSVLVVAVLFGTTLASSYGLIGGGVALMAFFGSILAHEFGHAFTARRYGIGTESIDLWALGGVARLDREAPSARAEGWVAVAGPFTSLALAALGIGAFLALDAAGVGGVGPSIAGWVGVVNGAIAVFNLLPGAPLDGGRLLKAWRWGRHGDRFRAGREAASAGRAVGWSLAGLGGVLLLNGHSGVMLLVTGAFIAMSARVEGLSIDVAERLQGVHVRDLTWFGIAHASQDTDAETMLWQRARLGEAGVVAIDGPNGTVAGMVALDQLVALPETQREFVSLASLMVPMNRLAKADPDESLGDVLGRLNPTAPIVTVWRDGRLLGVVPSKRLLTRLAAATAG